MEHFTEILSIASGIITVASIYGPCPRTAALAGRKPSSLGSKNCRSRLVSARGRENVYRFGNCWRPDWG